MGFAFHTVKFLSMNVVQLCTKELKFLVQLVQLKQTRSMHHVENSNHNPRTLNGCNTFYGMGIICTVTPSVSSSFAILRLEDTSTEDLIRLTEEIERENFSIKQDTSET